MAANDAQLNGRIPISHSDIFLLHAKLVYGKPNGTSRKHEANAKKKPKIPLCIFMV